MFTLKFKEALHESVSISIRPDLFLTDRQSQAFHSMLGHHNNTYVQNVSIIGSLVDNLWYFQALPVSQIIFSSKFGCYVNFTI